MVPTAGGTLMMVVVAARRVEKRVDVGKRSEVSESANRRRKGWDTGADGRQKQQRETEAGSVIGVFGEACCQRVGDALSLWLRCTKSETRLSRLGTPSVRHFALLVRWMCARSGGTSSARSGPARPMRARGKAVG